VEKTDLTAATALLIENSKHKHIWKLIATQQQQQALQEMEPSINALTKSFWHFLKKKAAFSGPVVPDITVHILTQKNATIVATTRLSLENDGASEFSELICLLYALQANTELFSLAVPVAEALLSLLERLAEEVSTLAGNYPNEIIRGTAWFSGALLRNCSDALALFFEKADMPTARAHTFWHKTRMTCSIMNHYPHIVGPDMITVAQAYEVIGNTKQAATFYNAVIADFERIASLYLDDINEKLTEEDGISLTALKDAYQGMVQVNGATEYKDKHIAIEHLLQSRPFEQPGESQLPG
jgi:hypothetical protein